ncbi:MAG: glycosyltransferase family 2 protein [Oscillospiraceae bacterium]
MYKFLHFIPPYFREFLLLIRGRLKRGYKKSIGEIIEMAQRDDKEFYHKSGDVRIWEKSFIKLCAATDNRGKMLAAEFYSNPIKILHENYPVNHQGMILICAVKDELENMMKLYSHYQSLGVKQFAFIDNLSSDGFVDFFSACSNVNLYQAQELYSSIRRQAWINRIMARYGFDRWYLVVDSDEYLDYNNADTKTVQDLVCFFESRRIKRGKAMMLDLYPREIKFNDSNVDFLKEYKFFDSKGYTSLSARNSLLIDGMQGGVRGRIFSAENTAHKPWLTKYPLMYLEAGDIQFQSHMSYPFYKNFKSKNHLVLRHYKFMPSDLTKYQQRAENKNFSAESKEYLQYIQIIEKGTITFYDEGVSQAFLDHNSFYSIAQMKKIDW